MAAREPSGNGAAPAVRLSGLGVRFGRSLVLRDISLDIACGERLAVVGESGAGKSTLLNVVAGLLPPSAGQLAIQGRDPRSLSPAERSVGLMFQSDALFPHLSAFENVAFPLHARRVDAQEVRKRVDRLLEQVGVADKARALPRQLSGGQRQRVALARALALEPAILLFDEPLANLDVSLRRKLRALLLQIQREVGFTMVLVTHDPDEAAQVGERIAVLHRGQLVALAPGRVLYWRPTNAYVAGLFGPFAMVYGARGADGAAVVDASAPQHFLAPQAGAPSAGSAPRLAGIARPEAILVRAKGSGALADGDYRWYGATVTEVRDLAERFQVRFRPDGAQAEVETFLRSSYDATPLDIGEALWWAIDWSLVHWLDPRAEPAKEGG